MCHCLCSFICSGFAGFSGGGFVGLGGLFRRGLFSADAQDLQDRVLLPMAIAAAVIMPATLLEDDNLLALRLRNDFGRNGQAFAVLQFRALTGQQNIIQCRSEEHTSELQSLMRISYAVFCLKKKNKYHNTTQNTV